MSDVQYPSVIQAGKTINLMWVHIYSKLFNGHANV